ncbi:GNAT family N-acetyltransferase [Bacillus sp. T33-2]|uniref:GNAT family N-acetyltransferase n=1 Tax=Bacillus sp. T33-2 TaxID=2054168 RepID=UPI0015E09778|nr:GNAT family N-acetyltransferase [Bacillus sp. T33-2]
MAEKRIVRATYEDLASIDVMFGDCKEYLESRGILQWDETYPNREYFEKALEGEEIFILKMDGQILGTMVLDEWQAPEWSEAGWTELNGKPLILHSFCVHPSSQGGGYGGTMLQFAEEFARQQGYSALRLDAYSGNESAVKFYEKRGYRKTGEVIMGQKRPGHQLYYCYEKLF